MSEKTYDLRLLEDNLRARSVLSLPEDGINRIVYVAHGEIEAGGARFADDSAWHGRGAVALAAGEHGAALWRWELAPRGTAPAAMSGEAGATRVKLVAPLDRAATSVELLMRADSVSFPPGGCAYLHTHQGPGIRCLIDGGVRIDTDGHSTSYAPGGAWFEAGPIPVFAQGAMSRPSRFIRVMVLPASLQGKSSINYVRAEDKDKPKSQSYKGYVDARISLS